MDDRERRLGDALRKGPAPSPPPGLNQAIKDEIPEVIPSASGSLTTRGQWWAIAAALVMMVGAGWLALNLIGSDPTSSTTMIADRPRTVGDEALPSPTAESRKAEEAVTPKMVPQAPAEATMDRDETAVAEIQPSLGNSADVAGNERFAPAPPQPPAVASPPPPSLGRQERARPQEDRVETPSPPTAVAIAESAAPEPQRSAASRDQAPVAGSITVEGFAPATELLQKQMLADQSPPALAYEEIRDSILDGRLPARESVDVDALINHFDYGDRPPWRRGNVSVLLEGGAASFLPSHWRTVRVGIRSTRGLETIGRDATVVVRFDPASVALYRPVGTSTIHHADREPSFTIPLGDLPPDYAHSWLFEVKFLTEIGLDQTVAAATLEYDASGDRAVQIERDLRVGHVASTWSSSSPTLRTATLVGAWAESLSGISHGIDPVELLHHARELATAPDADESVAELTDMIDQTVRLLRAQQRR